MKKLLNGKIVDMTAEEIKQHEEDVKVVEAEVKSYTDKVEADKVLKTSAETKLKGLGLTDDEIRALIGS